MEWSIYPLHIVMTIFLIHKQYVLLSYPNPLLLRVMGNQARTAFVDLLARPKLYLFEFEWSLTPASFRGHLDFIGYVCTYIYMVVVPIERKLSIEGVILHSTTSQCAACVLNDTKELPRRFRGKVERVKTVRSIWIDQWRGLPPARWGRWWPKALHSEVAATKAVCRLA